MALTSGFKAQVAAVGLATASLTMPAFAEDKPQQYASTTTSDSQRQATFSTVASSAIEVVPSAGSQAVRWAAENNGIAISVKLGTDRSITPEQILEVLSNEFSKEGVRNVSFYFEQNDIEATYLSYHYGKDGGASHGPFLLRDARTGAKDAAAQHRYYLQHPELGM